jgi:sugar phosphate isomerase/epimerase
MDRRGFLGGVLGAALGTAASGPLGRVEALSAQARRRAGGLPDTWGVQLYTLRALMQADVEGTLRAVAELGYGEVEFAGLFERDPGELRRTLDDLGLVAASAHVSLSEVESNLGALLDEADAMGYSMLVVPSLPRSAHSPEGYRRVADTLNAAGEVARARGVAVGFHNHDGELRPLGGDAGPDADTIPLELLLGRTDPANVTFQLDLYWAVHAGADPLALFARHPARFSSVHAKDRTADGTMVAVGDGAIDFARLLPAAEAAGVRHVFVEHDRPDDPLASVKRSIDHLESLR